MPIDYDALQQKKSKSSGRGWTPKSGDNVIRILPMAARFLVEAITAYAVEYQVHYLKVENKNHMTLCPKIVGGFCPACTLFWDHRKSENAALKKAVEDIKPNDRYLMNILDMADTAKGVQPYEGNHTVYHGTLNYISNREWGDILSITQGRNFTINLVPGDKSPTRRPAYTVMPSPAIMDVSGYLAQQPDWQQRLDQLPSHRPDAMPLSEILGIIKRLGLPDVTIPLEFQQAAMAQASTTIVQPAYNPPAPPPPTTYNPPPPPQNPVTATGQPVPTGFPPPPSATVYPPPPPPAQPYAPPPPPAQSAAPPAPPAQPPAAAAVPPAPAQVLPQQPGQPPANPAPPPVDAPVQAVVTTAQPGGWPAGLQFAPGAAYPTCFGEFDASKYPCDFPCPVKTQCQMKSVGIAL